MIFHLSMVSSNTHSYVFLYDDYLSYLIVVLAICLMFAEGYDEIVDNLSYKGGCTKIKDFFNKHCINLLDIDEDVLALKYGGYINYY